MPTLSRRLTASTSSPQSCVCATPIRSRRSLDRAEQAAVRHVTLLSTYNGDKAPHEIDVAAVEEDVASRQAFTHSILRPAWVMQNFIDEHLPIVDGTLAVPSNGGGEAFVDATDIAAVAVATLLQPEAHAGATYALTGPEAITFNHVAATITTVSGRPVTYQDIDQRGMDRRGNRCRRARRLRPHAQVANRRHHRRQRLNPHRRHREHP